MGANIPSPKTFNPPRQFGSSTQNNITQQAQAAAPIPQASFLPLNPAPATPAPTPEQPAPTQAASDPISQAIAQYRSSGGRNLQLSNGRQFLSGM